MRTTPAARPRRAPRPRRIGVVIAETIPELRALHRHALDIDGGFRVVGLAESAAAAVAMTAAERPDVVVLDDSLPGGDDTNVVADLLRVSPQTKVVLVVEPATGEAGGPERGAHAEVLKGAPQTELLSAIKRVVAAPVDGFGGVSGGRGALAAGAAVAPTDERDPLDALANLRHLESSMRVMRWIGIAFAVVQFTLYQPPPGVTVPFPRVLAAVVVVACLALVNLASYLASRSRSELALRTFGVGLLAADATIVMGIVWLFSFDSVSALWALLVVPVLEGARRYALRGAIYTWVALLGVYILREAWAADTYPDQTFLIDSVTYRLGIVLVVAFVSGALARDYAGQLRSHRVVLDESRRRAWLLRLVARAARTLSAVDVDKVLTAAVDATVAIGFPSAELTVFDERQSVWRVAVSRNMPTPPGGGQPLGSGLAGLVWQRGEPVVIDDYAAWEGGMTAARAVGFRTAVGVPIRSGDRVVAALIAATREHRQISPDEIECLELLAAQSGVGLRNARLVADVRHQAAHDPLTGLPNQLLFEDRLRLMLAQAARSGEVAGVVFADLDGFKQINDTLGHDVGDELLKQVAGRFLDSVRASDTVARLGGDEFAIGVSGVESRADVEAVGRKVVAAFEPPFLIAGRQIFSVPSLGYAVYPEDGETYEALLRRADLAMYDAKTRRRGDAPSTGPASATRAYSRISLAADLHRAVEDGELRVVYQPVFEMASGGVHGFEALVRWRHPTHGDVPPGEFIPVAEESGLVDRVDSFVLQTVGRQLRSWMEAALPLTRVAVNISARHLQHGDVAEAVRAAIWGAGVPAVQLELDVTESFAGDIDRLRLRLLRLKALGVHLALDGFGGGYSGIAQLRELPFDVLKIGRPFVHDATTASGRVIAQAMVTLGHGLGFRVLAQGVENADQLAVVREIGCDLAYGHHLGTPMSAEQATELLRARSGVGA